MSEMIDSKTVDRLAWWLPACSAVMSICGGVSAIYGKNETAAALGIIAGIASAGGVMFTGWASRIRDHHLAETRAIGTLGMDIAQRAQSLLPPNFGG
jgi:hypothetical protein